MYTEIIKIPCTSRVLMYISRTRTQKCAITFQKYITIVVQSLMYIF